MYLEGSGGGVVVSEGDRLSGMSRIDGVLGWTFRVADERGENEDC